MKIKNICPTEHQEQVAFFEWWKIWARSLPYLAFAIPNGGARHITTARKLKAEGVKSGVPDIFIAWPRGGFHGLFVELKRKVGGSVSKEQKEKIKELRNAGYAVVIAKGWEEAAELVRGYAFSGGAEFEPRKI